VNVVQLGAEDRLGGLPRAGREQAQTPRFVGDRDPQKLLEIPLPARLSDHARRSARPEAHRLCQPLFDARTLPPQCGDARRRDAGYLQRRKLRIEPLPRAGAFGLDGGDGARDGRARLPDLGRVERARNAQAGEACLRVEELFGALEVELGARHPFRTGFPWMARGNRVEPACPLLDSRAVAQRGRRLDVDARRAARLGRRGDQERRGRGSHCSAQRASQ
jgi:hypothetical protein